MYNYQQDSEDEEHFEIDEEVSQVSNIVRHQHEHLRLYDDGKLHFIHDIHLPEVEKLNKAELLLDTTQFQPNSTFDALFVRQKIQKNDVFEVKKLTKLLKIDPRKA